MAEDNDSANKDKPAMAEDPNTLHVLNQQRNWDTLYFYQKSDVVYQLAFAFCDRFIHLYKDRTRDQGDSGGTLLQAEHRRGFG